MRRLLAWGISPTLGGGERYLVELLLALDQLESILVTSPGPVSQFARAKGVEVHETTLGPKLGRKNAPRHALQFLRERREFDRIVASLRPDHMLLQYKLEQLLWGGRDLGVKVSMLEHGAIPAGILRTPIVRQSYLRALLSSHAAFAASEIAREAMVRLGRPNTVLQAGVTLERPSAEVVARMRAELTDQLPPTTKRIAVFASRLEPAKGVIEAVDLVLSTPGDAIVLAGTGSLDDQVRELASRESRVLFKGFQPDPASLIAASDYGVLLPQGPEGRPLFAIECLALGVPLVTNRSPAMVALASEPRVTGLTFAQDGKVPHLPEQEPLEARWNDTASRFYESLLE